jgi:hypothetical protein
MTLVLFVFPVSLLSAAWFSWAKPSDPEKTDAKRYPRWRKHCELAALILAMVATFSDLVFWLSWFHNGGSPHGMTPSPGLWRIAGRAGFYALITTVLLAVFTTGKRRWLLFSWGVALFVVGLMISIAEMD